MFNTMGNTAEKMGAAQQRYDDAQKAEEWRQKQWNNQRWQQDLANKRYEDEQRRLEDERSRSSSAAEALRKQFLEKYNYGSLEKYGPGAQFALSQIENAPDYHGVVAGGNTLSNIISQRDMIDAQRAVEAQEKFVPNFIKDYDTRLAYENQVDFNNPEKTAYGYSIKELDTKYRNLMGEKADLEALILSNPAYKDPEVVKRLNALDAMIKILRRRIMAIRHPNVRVY